MNIQCTYCGKSFSNRGIHNHIRRIHEGQKVNYVGGNNINWTAQRRKEWSEFLRVSRQTGKKHTKETKEKLSAIGLASKHRRVLRSSRPYLKKDGSTVILDSSWEERLAKRLDDIGINWVRPGPIQWQDSNGVSHNYFADFYLVGADVYLDPKNPIVCQIQAEKLKILQHMLPNLIILKSIEEIDNYDPIAQLERATDF